MRITPDKNRPPQAEHLFTPEQYQTTLNFMLDRCKVNTAKLEQTLALANAAMEDKRLSLSLSRMTVVQGRPRLRDRVTSVLKTEERKIQVRRTRAAPAPARVRD